MRGNLLADRVIPGLLLITLQVHSTTGLSAAHVVPCMAFVHMPGASLYRGFQTATLRSGIRPALFFRPGRCPGRAEIRVSLRRPANTRMQTFASEAPEFGPDFLTIFNPSPRRPVQTVDFTTLSAVSAELQGRLPLRVGHVRQAGETDISVTLIDPATYDEFENTRAESTSASVEPADGSTAAGARLWLSLSWHRKYGRMSFSATEPMRSSDSGVCTQ